MESASPGPSWLVVVTAVATVTAAFLALASIVHAGRLAERTRRESAAAAQEAREDAARERRLQYELTVLAEMSRQHDITGLQHLRGYTRALVRPDAPDDDLPLLRHLVQAHPTELGAAKDRAIDEEIDGLGPAARGTRDSRRARVVGREIEDAIDRRTGLCAQPEEHSTRLDAPPATPPSAPPATRPRTPTAPPPGGPL
jgi:hypothetical protein